MNMATENSILAELDQLPLHTRFELGSEITPLQEAFLDRHGFLIFNQVASLEEVAKINSEVDGIIASWIAENREEVFGIPLFKGRGLNGEDMIISLHFWMTLVLNLYGNLSEKIPG